MDRRQQKTRKAIFEAFIELLSRKSYDKITVTEIIEKANVGRATFYAHFETKDALLEGLCEELFNHIIDTAKHHNHVHNLSNESIFCHLLHHLQENDYNVLTLLSCDSHDLFLRYFKNSLNELIATHYQKEISQSDLPSDFLINHISSSFVEMTFWWIKNNMKLSPEQLDQYFKAIIEPIF